MVQSLWVKNMEVLLCHFCGRCCFRSWGSQLLMSSHLSLDSCRLLLGWESVNLSHCQTKCSPAQAQSRERKWLPWCGGIKPMEIDKWWQVRTWAPDYCPMTGHLFRPCTNGRSASATGLPMIWKKSNKLGLKLWATGPDFMCKGLNDPNHIQVFCALSVTGHRMIFGDMILFCASVPWLATVPAMHKKRTKKVERFAGNMDQHMQEVPKWTAVVSKDHGCKSLELLNPCDKALATKPGCCREQFHASAHSTYHGNPTCPNWIGKLLTPWCTLIRPSC